MSAIASFLGRLMLALLFVLAGLGKIIDPGGAQQMLQNVGLQPWLATPTGIFEVVVGLCLAVGVMTRLSAILLFGFTLLATLFFHRDLADPMQQTMALKNIAIAGGLLVVFAYGQMHWSYDRMRLRRRGERDAADANARAHEAELRAAHAEGRAEGRAEAVGVPDRDGDGHPG